MSEREETMTATPARRAAWKRSLTAAQHTELRAVLAAELRRLASGPPSRHAESTAPDALDGLEPRLRRRGLQLLDALRRIDAGTFGICTGCRSPISYVRLSVIPETTLCVRCSSARELPARA